MLQTNRDTGFSAFKKLSSYYVYIHKTNLGNILKNRYESEKLHSEMYNATIILILTTLFAIEIYNTESIQLFWIQVHISDDAKESTASVLVRLEICHKNIFFLLCSASMGFLWALLHPHTFKKKTDMCLQLYGEPSCDFRYRE